MTIAIRLAAPADIAATHAIRLAVKENRLSAASAVTPDSYRPFIDDCAQWVALVAGRIAGFAALDTARASVWALFVDPLVEGVGVGHALHDALIADAARRGLSQLHLTTSPGTRAEKFYRARGWEQAGTTASGELCLRRSIAGQAGRDAIIPPARG